MPVRAVPTAKRCCRGWPPVEKLSWPKSLMGCLAGLGIIVAWPHSATVLWLGTVATGLSMASIFPTALSLAERRLAITGKVTGWFIVGSAAGSMTLPWLMGPLFEYVGPRAMILTLWIDLLTAAAILDQLDP
jgi:FHS family Na+ dependent glucose MFS transporter 1